MSTYRAKHNHGEFFTMAKAVIQDDMSISYRAKGLLAYIISHSDNWEINLTDLVRHSSEGYGAIRTALNELESAGYIVRRRFRKADGTFEWIHEVYETPAPEDKRTNPDDRKTGERSPVAENPQVDNPQVDEPQVETCQILRNNELRNNENVTDMSKSNSDLPQRPHPEQKPHAEQATLLPEFDLSLGGKYDYILKDAIARNVSAKTGRNARGPRRFQTVQQRDAWRNAVAAIEASNNGTSENVLAEFVEKAFTAGRSDMGSVVNYVATCARNGGKLYKSKRTQDAGHYGMSVTLPD